MLSLLGILSEKCGPEELGLLISRGLLSSVQTLLRLIGPESHQHAGHHFGYGNARIGNLGSSKRSQGFGAIFEDMLQRGKSSPPPLSGPELARLMGIGVRVVRGPDWKWTDQDGEYLLAHIFSQTKMQTPSETIFWLTIFLCFSKGVIHFVCTVSSVSMVICIL